MRGSGGKTGKAQKQQASKADADKAKGTKLIVRNVAFEATRKDLMALFQPFGQIKSCRLPKKFDSSHRCCHVCNYRKHQIECFVTLLLSGSHVNTYSRTCQLCYGVVLSMNENWLVGHEREGNRLVYVI